MIHCARLNVDLERTMRRLFNDYYSHNAALEEDGKRLFYSHPLETIPGIPTRARYYLGHG